MRSEAREALLQLDPPWDELFPGEQARNVQLLIERVDVRMHGIEVRAERAHRDADRGAVQWCPRRIRPRRDRARKRL